MVCAKHLGEAHSESAMSVVEVIRHGITYLSLDLQIWGQFSEDKYRTAE